MIRVSELVLWYFRLLLLLNIDFLHNVKKPLDSYQTRLFSSFMIHDLYRRRRSVVSKMPKFNLNFNGIIQTSWPHLNFQVWKIFLELNKKHAISFLLINKQTIFRWDMSPEAHLKLSEIFQLFWTDFFRLCTWRFSMSGNT